jgi:hypothetical protein
MSFSHAFSTAFDVSSADTVPGPSPEQTERIKTAVILKATRFLLMSEASLGWWGEATEFGVATVKPDYALRELLYGLHLTVDVDVASVAALVTVDEVIRNGLQLEPGSLPVGRQEDVERCIDAAADWVVENLERSFGVG